MRRQPFPLLPAGRLVELAQYSTILCRLSKTRMKSTCPPAGGKITAQQIEQARKESASPPAGLPVACLPQAGQTGGQVIPFARLIWA
jgi:hypothetical protein